MAEEIHHPDGRIEHPSVRSEPTDASFRRILYLILGAMVFAAVVHYAILEFFYAQRGHEDRAKPSPYPLAPEPSTTLPRGPRLEQIERPSPYQSPWNPARGMPSEPRQSPAQSADVSERESARLAKLNSYGEAGEVNGEKFVHIPIEQAMRLVLEQKKLPHRTEPTAGQRQRPDGLADSEGLIDAGGPNSGRMLRGKVR